MKKMQKAIIGILMAALFLVVLCGCSGSPAAPKGDMQLELDYMVGQDVQEGKVSQDEEGINWTDWLKDKLSGNSGSKGKKPEAEKENADTNGSEEESGLKDWYQNGGNTTDRDDGLENESKTESEGSQNTPPKDNDKNSGTSDGGQNNEPSAPEDNSSQGGKEPAAPESGKKTVTMHIRCDTAVNNGMHKDPKWAGIVPANGIILSTTTFEIEEGDTVFDVLCQARDKYKIHMQYTGKGSSIYVQGINNLYEFDGGRRSGRMYSVDGWYPNYGCGIYYLKGGESIEWNYTCDLGLDLDAGMEGAEDWKDTHD